MWSESSDCNKYRNAVALVEGLPHSCICILCKHIHNLDCKLCGCLYIILWTWNAWNRSYVAIGMPVK